MPILHHNGADLFYDVTGSGPALVFAHGLGGNHISWWQQVPHFRDRYTCVTFAHRGFAPSTDAPDGPGPRAFADDLTALIAHLGLSDVRLVAQSMGGWTCLEYTLRHPERVRALVMACTTGTLDSPELRRIFAAHRGGEAELFARGIHPAAGERMAREQPALHHLYRQIDGLSFALDKQIVRTTLTQMRTAPAEAVAALAVPVLCLTGEEDVVIPPDAVAYLSGLIPSARLARVHAAGHSVYFERPDTFNGIVDDFLSVICRD
jgi:3-oxoadipate enol-lactonase